MDAAVRARAAQASRSAERRPEPPGPRTQSGRSPSPQATQTLSTRGRMAAGRAAPVVPAGGARPLQSRAHQPCLEKRWAGSWKDCLTLKRKYMVGGSLISSPSCCCRYIQH